MHKFGGYSRTYIVIFMNLSADVVCILYRTEETGFIERMLFSSFLVNVSARHSSMRILEDEFPNRNGNSDDEFN